MVRINFRIWAGSALTLLGLLMLLEQMGVFRNAVHFFVGLIFLAVGVYFLRRFAIALDKEWWALIPGIGLIGLGLASLLPASWSGWSGLISLGCFGISFFAVFFSRRERWWALIPGGILVTLGITSVMNDYYGAGETGGIFFLGLGLTFLLVAVLAAMPWAYIPALILMALGGLLGTTLAPAVNYVFPLAFILGGLLLMVQFFYRA